MLAARSTSGISITLLPLGYDSRKPWFLAASVLTQRSRSEVVSIAQRLTKGKATRFVNTCLR